MLHGAERLLFQLGGPFGGFRLLPGEIQPVENGDEIKEKGTPLPIVRTAPLLEYTFNYNSPNKVWRYAAAPFAWLLVDLPVTKGGTGNGAAFWLMNRNGDYSSAVASVS